MGIDEKILSGESAGDLAVAMPPPTAAASPNLVRRLGRGYVRPAIEAAAQRPRIWKYRLLSTCRRIEGEPVALQPVLFVGPGEVVLGDGVQFGWKSSPLFYAGYCHVETTVPHARIEIGDRTEFNNNLMIKSEGAGIRIGKDGLFGANVEIFDSNFHDLHPERRKAGTQRIAPVEIGDNVFVGMGVKILKGVTIGHDSVIGAGSVVSSSIPAGVVAAGSPARVVREL
jgi:maltose O-acetyltransferase